MTIDNRYEKYLQYRVDLKLKSLKPVKPSISSYSANFAETNPARIEEIKSETEKEISVLLKHGIIPLKTPASLKSSVKEKKYFPVLPEYIYLYGNKRSLVRDDGSFENSLGIGTGIFVTSSRYAGGKIFRPGSKTLDDFKAIYLDNRPNTIDLSIYSGMESRGEIDLINLYARTKKITVLPSMPLLEMISRNSKNRSVGNCSGAVPDNVSFISAMDPFLKNSRLGFISRNALASAISSELVILFLSKGSSLASLIKVFNKAGKPVKIFETTEAFTEPRENRCMQDSSLEDGLGSPISEFIMQILGKENISIDNLLKLSNIKLHADIKETLRAISSLEIHSKIERCAGGIIKIKKI